MPHDLPLALLMFTAAATFTPGPNNIMLMASGASFGFLRTVPHMLGIAGGMVVLVLGMGAGLGQALALMPGLQRWLSAVALAYLLWLAWKVGRAPAPDEHSLDRQARSAARPLTLLQAAAFQWVNPKAWAIVLAALSIHAPALGLGTGLAPVGVVAAAFGLVALPSSVTWAALGLQAGRLLGDPGRRRVFNWTMAALMVASVVPMLG